MRRRNSFSPLKLIFLGVPFAVLLLFLYFRFLGFKKSLFVSPIPLSYKVLVSSLKNNKSSSVDSLKTLLLKNNIQFSSVEERSGSFFSVKLNLGEEVFFSPDKSLDKQISSLQFILTRLTIEGKRFNRLDLRFDKPVIIFK